MPCSRGFLGVRLIWAILNRADPLFRKKIMEGLSAALRDIPRLRPAASVLVQNLPRLSALLGA